MEKVKHFVDALEMILGGGRIYADEFPQSFISARLTKGDPLMGRLEGFTVSPAQGCSNQLFIQPSSLVQLIRTENWTVDKEWQITDGLEMPAIETEVKDVPRETPAE